jgi:NADP-dependent 3-hydroxy acid dehydrogenase YdfG
VKRLINRVAVVTGAGSGIGRATSEALARAGCNLALVDISPTAVEETATTIRSLGRHASTHVVDVRDADALAALPAAVVDAHGACHILVNNAGVTSAGPFEDESLDDLRWIVDINVWGVVNGCRAFLPVLRDADEAHIVNLSSMVGLLGLPQNASYSLTKGAVRGFSEALRNELVTTNIGVTAVFPGAINTNITNSARGSQSGRLAELGRSRLAPLAMRPPSAVAKRIVAAIEQDRGRAVVGPDAHLVSLWSRVAPGRAGLIGRLTARL